MKNRMKKILTMLLAATVMLGAVQGTVYAINNESDKAVAESAETTETTEAEEIKTDGATVYVFTEENGKVNDVIATDDILDDAADKNVKLEKELQVDLKITYTLDGKEVKPEKLEGKSGHLVIRYDYENTQSQMMNVNGHREKIYVPYACVTGVIFEDDNFKNVEVKNGKMIDDGAHTIVAGIALPGIKENLRVNNSDIEIPDFVEISADIENYEHPEALTICTSQVFSELDTDSINGIDGLKDSVNKLTDAMNQLMDGSDQLYEGISLLEEKSGELKEGVDKLESGSLSLKNGALDLDSGASSIRDGSDKLYDTLSLLTSKNETLQGGALQVYNSILSSGTSQIKASGIDIPALTKDNYAGVLTGVISGLDPEAVYNTALTEVTNQVEAKRTEIKAAVTEAVKEQVEAQVKEGARAQVVEGVEARKDEIKAAVIDKVLHISLEDYNKAVEEGKIPELVQTKVDEAVEGQAAKIIEEKMESDEIKQLIASKIEETMASDEIVAKIEELTNLKVQELIAGAMQSDEVQNKFAEAEAGLKALVELKSSLDSYDAFYNGLMTYTNGVASVTEGSLTLKNGAHELKDGTTKMVDGSGQLYDGISYMKGNTPALLDGISQLKDGSLQLSDGLKQFNDEGIDKLVKAYNDDIEPLIERVKAMINAAKDHDTFADVTSEKESEIKYIYRTK